MTRNSTPACEPTSYKWQIWACVTEERVLASRSNRIFNSELHERWDGRILMATERSKRVSRARYTSPMPPAPRAATISYAPSLVPAERSMSGANYSVTDDRQRRGVRHCVGRLQSAFPC